MKTTESKTPAENTPVAEHTRSGVFFRPAVDIIELEDELLVVADVPGADPKKIDVSFEDHTLTLHAKVEPRWGEDAKFVAQEYDVGDFYRVFQVGESIDAQKISAEYRNGVLTLHLPKADVAKPRKIQVKAE
ncbi:MAG: Hsp20/alpha crystallin family protein [Planctomycetota bacterium]|nr:MAG: Hsp20/alpha crystallin family protein [Planctomycetota bacterium]